MTGVVELNDNIYVVVANSNKVKVFGRSPSYNSLDDIVVKEMKNPWDLAAELITGHLYIADWDSLCVWRLDVKGEQDSDDKEKSIDKLNMEVSGPVTSFFKPLSPSTTETGQVLDVDCHNSGMTIWSGQGGKPEVINLINEDLSDTRHVIHASSETFLVVHGNRVRLVAVEKRYGGPLDPIGLPNPRHLSEVSADGHKFVVDDERVLVLSPRLNSERTLVLRPSESKNPGLGWQQQRLCYSRSSGRLLASWGGKYVWVYTII